LMMLTASRPIARAGELGTGYGVGAAWIASGLRPGGSLVTVEIDPERAAIAREAVAGHSEIEVITGDWACAKQHGPFDILFSDGGPKRKPGDPELLAPLLRPGGILLLDDYTPEGAWTTEQRALFADDVSRRIWLQNPRWIACELQTAPDMAVIVAVYIGDWGSTSHESSQQVLALTKCEQTRSRKMDRSGAGVSAL
jgi:predicted O-methyltransferase YrrM